jgi:predicted hotdog family 3-hydroxylacyl-ACP dehydratase
VGVAAPPFYLAALRDAHLQVTRLDDIDSPLEIRAQRVFGDASNAIYECRVLARDTLLADARITFMLRT